MISLYVDIAIRVSRVPRDRTLPKWCDWNIKIGDGHSSFLDSSASRYQQLLNTAHVVLSDQVYQIINCLEFQSNDTKFIILESIENNPNLVRYL